MDKKIEKMTLVDQILKTMRETIEDSIKDDEELLKESALTLVEGALDQYVDILESLCRIDESDEKRDL